MPIDVFLLLHILNSSTSSLSANNIILHGLLPTGSTPQPVFSFIGGLVIVIVIVIAIVILPTGSTPPPVSSFIGGLGLGTRIVSTLTSSLLRSIQELLSESKLISPINHRSLTRAQQWGMS